MKLKLLPNFFVFLCSFNNKALLSGERIPTTFRRGTRKSHHNIKKEILLLFYRISLYKPDRAFYIFFGRFLSLCHKKQLPQGQNCFLMNILMNGGQLWPDDLRIKIIIKAGNGNLIWNPDSLVCKKLMASTAV